MIVVILGSLVFLAFGVAHHRGAMKHAVFYAIFGIYSGAAAAWIGGGGVLVGVSGLITESADGPLEVLGLLVGVVGVAVFAVGAVGVFWMPRRLRPAWLRDWDDRGRPAAEARAWRPRRPVP